MYTMINNGARLMMTTPVGEISFTLKDEADRSTLVTNLSCNFFSSSFIG